MAMIQVLGTGCPKCGHLAASADQAVKEMGRDDVIEKVTDITEILRFEPLALPALAIDGRVVAAGTVPSPDQIRHFLVEQSTTKGQS